MKKIVLLCIAMGCGFFAIAEPYVPLPAVPMTPLRPTVEELNKAKEREATALREKEKADAEIARLKAEIAKKPNVTPTAPAVQASTAPVSVASSAATAALDWVDKNFSKLKWWNIWTYVFIASFLGFIGFIYFWLTQYIIADGEIIDGRYQILANGTEVKDLETNLIWQRWEVGEKDFDDAKKQESNRWRLPTIDELKTLW